MRLLFTFTLFLGLATTTLPAQTAQELLEAGKKAHSEKNYEKALEALEKAQALDKKNPEIHAQMSLAYIQLERYGKASGAAKIAQKLNPKEARYVYYQAIALDSMRRDIEVLQVTNKALKMKDEISGLYVLRANIFLRKKEYNTTIANLNKAIELDPKNGIAYQKRAYARHRVVDSSGACADWRKALSLGIIEAQIFLNAHCKE